MKAAFQYNGKNYTASLTNPIDISIPLVDKTEQVNCFYAPLYETSPVVMGDFVGSTAAGGAVNFLNIRLNPHGNGTHTECVGHIATEPYTINQTLRTFHFPARLVSLYPEQQPNGDRVLTRKALELIIPPYEKLGALVIRTLPNHVDKLHRSYSGTNPPYMEPEAVDFLVGCGLEHLLIDLPSIDREEDGGALAAHKAFWQYPFNHTFNRSHCTISELIYVPDEVSDGIYLLHLSIASFEIDVSPSKPVLYPIVPE